MFFGNGFSAVASMGSICYFFAQWLHCIRLRFESLFAFNSFSVTTHCLVCSLLLFCRDVGIAPMLVVDAAGVFASISYAISVKASTCLNSTCESCKCQCVLDV